MQPAESEKPRFDLAIIGGGPSGTAAALEAKRRGLRVGIWERDRFPRHKVCGEFISSESLPLLRQEISADLVRSSVIRRAEFISQAGRRYSFDLPCAARGLSRSVMDQALWLAAIRSGAEACEGTAIRRIGRRQLRTGEFWEVEAATGERRHARSLLIACGRWWSLQDFPSPPQDARATGSWLAAKAHFAGVLPGDAVQMFFFPGGYCGLAPIEDGLLNVCCLVHSSLACREGVGVLSDFALWLKRAARHPALDSRLRHAIQASETVATAPVRPARRRADFSGALLAGDAAGFLDPFTGDGISQALHAGRLAAEVIAHFCEGTGDTLAAAPATYRRQLSRAVGRSYRVAGLLRLLVRAPAEVQGLAAILLSGFAARLIKETRWHAAQPLERRTLE